MTSHRAAIRQWDLIALATERRDLTIFDAKTSAPWSILDTPGQEVRPAGDQLLYAAAREVMTWRQWRDSFTARFTELREAVQQMQAGEA